MRFAKLAMLIAFGAVLSAALPAFAGPMYCSTGNGFSVLCQADPAYLNSTYLYTPTSPNGSTITQLGPFYFSSAVTVVPPPQNWPSSNQVLATTGSTLTIDSSDYDNGGAKVLGFYLLPENLKNDDILVQFFSGNILIGTIQQYVNGGGSAQLFAAVRTSYFNFGNGQRDGGLPFTSVQITDLPGNSFDFGELRAAPEPSSLMLLGPELLILAGLLRRQFLI